jgi:hypothetical protein
MQFTYNCITEIFTKSYYSADVLNPPKCIKIADHFPIQSC